MNHVVDLALAKQRAAKAPHVLPYPVPRAAEPDMVEMRRRCMDMAVSLFGISAGTVADIYAIADDFVKYALTGEHPSFPEDE
jgi:hypothetical protein